MGRRFRVIMHSGSIYDFEVVEDKGVLKTKRLDTGEEFEFAVEKIDEENYVVKTGSGKYRISLRSGLVTINGEPARVANITELIPIGVEIKHELATEVVVARKGEIRAPLSGKIESLKVKRGDYVKEGDVVALMISMKMVVEIKSDVEGVVEDIHVEPGKAVKAGELIMRIKPNK